MLRQELKNILKEILTEELCTDAPLSEAAATDPMYGPDYYLVVTECAGDDSYVRFMTNDRAKAIKEYRSLVRDYNRYGLGGGDSTIMLLEYHGRPKFFRDIYQQWLPRKEITYNRALTTLGFDMNDLEELAIEYA